MLTAHNGVLLRALETIAAQILRLDQRENDLISFDAGNFKALRAQELKLQAETAAEKVMRTGVPYAFPPMNSRERRLLHLAFKSIEGVETASSGEGPARFLAVYPAGKTDLPEAPPADPFCRPDKRICRWCLRCGRGDSGAGRLPTIQTGSRGIARRDSQEIRAGAPGTRIPF